MSYITVKDMNEVTHLIQTKNVVPLIKTLTFDLFNDRTKE